MKDKNFLIFLFHLIMGKLKKMYLLKIFLVFSIRKMVIPWTNYQRNLTEQYSCIKAQTQALKCQLNWKQQQYKSLLMKGPKAKEKIRENRRQIEQLLQLVNQIFS